MILHIGFGEFAMGHWVGGSYQNQDSDTSQYL
jgi:hypothetical protein